MQSMGKITLLGVIVFFISWIAENLLYKGYSEQKSKMELDISFINTAMSGITPWFIHFVTEARKEPLDEELVWNSSYSYVKGIAPVMEVGEQYVDQTQLMSRLTRDKLEKITIDLQEAKEKREIKKIIELTMLVAYEVPSVGEITRKEIQKTYADIHRKEKKYKYVFMAAYIVGFLISVLGYRVKS